MAKGKGLKKTHRRKSHKKSRKGHRKTGWSFRLRGSDTYITNVSTSSNPNQLLINNSNTYLTTNGGTTPTGKTGTLIALQPSINNTNVVAFGMSACFTAAQIVDSALFSHFDKYKVNGVTIKIYPSVNMATSAGTSTLPRMSWRFDPDDARISTNGASILGTTHKSVLLNKPVKIFIKPKALLSMADFGSTAPGAISSSLNRSIATSWVNCGDLAGAMYGLKFWFDDLSIPSGTNFDIKIETTYHVSFKDLLNGVSPQGDEVDYEPPKEEVVV